MPHLISLIPLTADLHLKELTRLYRSVPTYRAERGLTGSPFAQAERDLAAAATTPDRNLLGILRAVSPQDPHAGAALTGLIDFRLHWPEAGIAYIGLILVAEARQRQGIGGQAWLLLEAWLRDTAAMRQARCSIEQFNPAGLRFMQAQGFHLTGKTDRMRRGDRLIRLLEMTKTLTSEGSADSE